MKKNSIWYILPAALLPYFALGTLTVIFFSTKVPVLETVMESVFRGNIWNLIALLLLFCLLAAGLCVVYFVSSIRKEYDALQLAKCAMAVKLLQVPAYIAIFVLGVLLVLAIFMIPFAVGLLLVDCLTLLLTGLMTVAAVINAVRQGYCKTGGIIWIVVLQFIFCADVIAAALFYGKLKRKYKEKTAEA